MSSNVTTISSIQFKRGAKSVLEATLVDDRKPLKGEPVYEIDTGKLKIGDGEHDYKDIGYIGDESSDSRLEFRSTYDLPSVGTSGILYIIKDEGNAYFWDEVKNKYSLVSVDSRQIDGGGADTIYF